MRIVTEPHASVYPTVANLRRLISCAWCVRPQLGHLKLNFTESMFELFETLTLSACVGILAFIGLPDMVLGSHDKLAVHRAVIALCRAHDGPVHGERKPKDEVNGLVFH